MSLGRDPRWRSPPYLGWIAGLPCIAHMARTAQIKHEVQVAHVRASYPEEEGWREVGKGEKPHDWRTLPLCVRCHLDGPEAQHKSNEAEWYERLGIYPPDVCAALMVAYQAGMPGHPIIARFAARARAQRLSEGT